MRRKVSSQSILPSSSFDVNERASYDPKKRKQDRFALTLLGCGMGLFIIMAVTLRVRFGPPTDKAAPAQRRRATDPADDDDVALAAASRGRQKVASRGDARRRKGGREREEDDDFFFAEAGKTRTATTTTDEDDRDEKTGRHTAFSRRGRGEKKTPAVSATASSREPSRADKKPPTSEDKRAERPGDFNTKRGGKMSVPTPPPRREEASPPEKGPPRNTKAKTPARAAREAVARAKSAAAPSGHGAAKDGAAKDGASEDVDNLEKFTTRAAASKKTAADRKPQQAATAKNPRGAPPPPREETNDEQRGPDAPRDHTPASSSSSSSSSSSQEDHQAPPQQQEEQQEERQEEPQQTSSSLPAKPPPQPKRPRQVPSERATPIVSVVEEHHHVLAYYLRLHRDGLLSFVDEVVGSSSGSSVSGGGGATVVHVDSHADLGVPRAFVDVPLSEDEEESEFGGGAAPRSSSKSGGEKKKTNPAMMMDPRWNAPTKSRPPAPGTERGGEMKKPTPTRWSSRVLEPYGAINDYLILAAHVGLIDHVVFVEPPWSNQFRCCVYRTNATFDFVVGVDASSRLKVDVAGDTARQFGRERFGHVFWRNGERRTGAKESLMHTRPFKVTLIAQEHADLGAAVASAVDPNKPWILDVDLDAFATVSPGALATQSRFGVDDIDLETLYHLVWNFPALGVDYHKVRDPRHRDASAADAFLERADRRARDVRASRRRAKQRRATKRPGLAVSASISDEDDRQELRSLSKLATAVARVVDARDVEDARRDAIVDFAAAIDRAVPPPDDADDDRRAALDAEPVRGQQPRALDARSQQNLQAFLEQPFHVPTDINAELDHVLDDTWIPALRDLLPTPVLVSFVRSPGYTPEHLLPNIECRAIDAVASVYEGSARVVFHEDRVDPHKTDCKSRPIYRRINRV